MKSAPRIARITDPNHLMISEVIDLFNEAFSSADVLPGDFIEYLPEFSKMVTLKRICILLGEEGGVLAGLAVVILPSDRLVPLPQVYHFYNRGSAKMRDCLIEGVVDFVRKGGYKRFRAINLSGRSNDAWKKVFKKAGSIRPVGDIMEFSING